MLFSRHPAREIAHVVVGESLLVEPPLDPEPHFALILGMGQETHASVFGHFPQPRIIFQDYQVLASVVTAQEKIDLVEQRMDFVTLVLFPNRQAICIICVSGGPREGADETVR